MDRQEMLSKAQYLNIDLAGKSDLELIWLIQKKEGNQPCFDVNIFDCKYGDCCWRKYCQPVVRSFQVVR